MPIAMNPDTLRPTRGRALVVVVERLGGMTKGGIFVPAFVEDRDAKDLATVKVLRTGEPSTRYMKTPEKKHERFSAWTKGGEEWPADYEPVEVGDHLVVPRDIPIVIDWEGVRYGIINLWEACLNLGPDYDSQVFKTRTYHLNE